MERGSTFGLVSHDILPYCAIPIIEVPRKAYHLSLQRAMGQPSLALMLVCARTTERASLHSPRPRFMCSASARFRVLQVKILAISDIHNSVACVRKSTPRTNEYEAGLVAAMC